MLFNLQTMRFCALLLALPLSFGCLLKKREHQTDVTKKVSPQIVANSSGEMFHNMSPIRRLTPSEIMAGLRGDPDDMLLTSSGLPQSPAIPSESVKRFIGLTPDEIEAAKWQASQALNCIHAPSASNCFIEWFQSDWYQEHKSRYHITAVSPDHFGYGEELPVDLFNLYEAWVFSFRFQILNEEASAYFLKLGAKEDFLTAISGIRGAQVDKAIAYFVANPDKLLSVYPGKDVTTLDHLLLLLEKDTSIRLLREAKLPKEKLIEAFNRISEINSKKLLLPFLPKTYLTNELRLSPVFQAVATGDTGFILSLFAINPSQLIASLIRKNETFGTSALDIAFSEGHVEMANLFIKTKIGKLAAKQSGKSLFSLVKQSKNPSLLFSIASSGPRSTDTSLLEGFILPKSTSWDMITMVDPVVATSFVNGLNYYSIQKAINEQYPESKGQRIILNGLTINNSYGGLSFYDFRGVDLLSVTISESDFSNTIWDGKCYSCTIDGSSFSGAYFLETSRFVDSMFLNSNFQESVWNNVAFYNSVLVNNDFSFAKFKTNINTTSLADNDFVNAGTSNVTLARAKGECNLGWSSANLSNQYIEECSRPVVGTLIYGFRGAFHGMIDHVLNQIEKRGMVVQTMDHSLRRFNTETLIKEVRQIAHSPDFESIARNTSILQAVFSIGIRDKTSEIAQLAKEAEDKVAVMDGIMLPGGQDIEEFYYHGLSQPHTIDQLVGVRDLAEAAIIRAAYNRRIPIFGVCRGHQLINVYFGGDMHREVANQSGVTQNIEIVKRDGLIGSRLPSEIVGNSYHYQAVDKVGKGLEVVGTVKEDGMDIIKMTQSTSDNPGHIYTFQFHPEMESHESNTTLLDLYFNDVWQTHQVLGH